MAPRHKIWAIRVGIGAGACALLTAWMVPNTKPIAPASPLAAMSATAEAQKPSVSAIPDSAIPAWAASLQQAPAAQRPIVAPPAPDAAPPIETADTADSPPVPIDVPPASGDDSAPAPAPPTAASPPTPDPMLAYRARRAEWQAQIEPTLQGQRNPG